MNIEKNIVLSIDIGTTCTHLAAVDTDSLSCVNRIDFLSAEFDDCLPSAVKTIRSAQPQIRKAKISSCVKDLAAKAKSFFEKENLPDGFDLVKAHGELPVMFKYENFQALGQDRVCNALACAALFGKQNCIIIDAGTAITIDYLRGEMFEGGVILPGVLMQFDALHRRTDALPSVDLDVNDFMTMTFPSTSTENCIKAGVLYGTAGAVDRCVGEYLRVFGNDNNDTKIVAAGGGWGAIMPFVTHKVTAIPGLTLIGAAVYEGLGK
jgi:type III pantothenate kinase